MPNLNWYLEPHDPELQATWALLGDLVSDPVMEHGGSTWQYCGTRRTDSGRYAHLFNHENHPDGHGDVNQWVPATPGWAPADEPPAPTIFDVAVAPSYAARLTTLWLLAANDPAITSSRTLLAKISAYGAGRELPTDDDRNWHYLGTRCAADIYEHLFVHGHRPLDQGLALMRVQAPHSWQPPADRAVSNPWSAAPVLNE